MSRLIDADKLGLTDFEIIECNGDYKEALIMLIKKIENAPTAYDIDKVVEKLKQEIVWVDQWGKRYCSQQNAIEIVKRGGKE